MSNREQVKPEIGMGATVYHYSDREAATVIEISKSGKRIKIQVDTATRIDNNGMSEIQEYEYSADPNGKVYQAYLASNGEWYLLGDGRSKRHVSLGVRRKYYDYSF